MPEPDHTPVYLNISCPIPSTLIEEHDLDEKLPRGSVNESSLLYQMTCTVINRVCWAQAAIS